MRRARDEAGFTMTEVLIVTLVMGFVSLMLLQTLDSFTRTTARVETRSFVLNESRFALETITRDLRAANPIDAVTPVSLYDNQVSFSVYCTNTGINGCGSDNLRPITYRVQNNQLQRVVGTETRRLAGPLGTSSLPTAQRAGAVINSSAEPVFTYFDRNGVKLLTTGASTSPPSHFRDCARSVQIKLKVRSDAGIGGETTDLSTRVDLRNYNEVTGC